MKKKHPHRGAPSRGLVLESLEPRLLLSADLAPVPDILATEPSLVPAEHRALAAFDPAPSISMRLEAHEIAFIDGSIADRERLLADFMRATGPDRAIEIVVLDPARDGIAQIGDALAARKGLTAVHVLSHGRDGAIDLGAATLDAAALAGRADAIAGWAGAFARDGDLLLFGCDVADTVRGEGFLGELARLTGADVAASDDPTGDAARGGDWDLELATGAIEAAFAPLADAAWGGLLATGVLDWDGGVGIAQPGGVGTPYTTGAVSLAGGTVTVTVSGYSHNGATGAVDNVVLAMLTSGSPVIDQSESGGLGPAQNTLRLVSTGFEPDDPGNAADGWQGFLITIDFSHVGGVSNVAFSIFDVDEDGGAGFVDEIVATSNQGVPTTTLNGTRNALIAPGIVRGTGNSPASQGFGNATFQFAQSGLTQIQVFYKNAGGQTTQGIGLHDVSFAVNDPPAIGVLGTLNYVENDAAAVIAGGATVTDADSANFDTGTLTVRFVANGTPADQLAIRNQGTGAAQIGVSGANVTYGGTTIGTFAGGTNGTNLVVTLNASATPAAVEALARNVTFANISEAPSTAARTVRFTVTDGDSGSAFAEATVNVAAANDAPVLAGANDLGATAEDLVANAGTAVSALIAAQLTDVDASALAGIAVTAVDGANGAWEFSTDGGTSWTAFGAPSVGAAPLLRDSDLVRFVPAADWNGTATMSFRGWDRTSGAPGGTADTNANGGTTAFALAVRTSSIAVTAVGDTVNDAAGTNEDTPVTIDVLANDNFENPGRTLTAVTGAANGAVGFTAAGAIIYTADAHWHGGETLTYTVSSNGVTETGTLTITVTPVADAPTLTVGAASGNEDTVIAIPVAAALVDADGSETLAVTVSSIPVGATISDGTNSFTASAGNTIATITGWNLAQLRITPPANSDVDFTLAVAATATEGPNGAVATTNANLAVTVDAVADAPTLTVNPAAGNEDTVIALSIATALVDTDGSETLSIAVSAIPIGAVLTDGVNTFTASAGNQVANVTSWNLAALAVTPPANADTDFILTVTTTATEGANGSVATSVAGLAADVLPVNDAPTVAAPAALDVIEDVASPLLGISFGDVDAGAGLVTATFTVARGTLSATAGGGVAVGGTATARTLTGTLAAINAFLAGGGLGYTTVFDSNAPVALTATLNDLGNTGAGGPLASPNANVTLNVIPVNDAPVLGGVALEIDAGGTIVLTGANMSATDVDDAPPSLVFFIAGLQNGRFELAGNPGAPVLAFTQAQVAAGQVKFVQTDPLYPPSYLVFVTDGASTVGPGIVALTFRPLGEAVVSKGARDDGGLPQISFASRSVDTSGGGLSDPFAIRFNRQPIVPTDGGNAAIAEAEAVTPVAGSRLPVGTPGSIFEVRPRGIAGPERGFAEMDRLPSAIPPLEFGVGPQRPHEEPRRIELALDAIRTAGLVVSVGAVWWAARAAGLVSSLLAITPTWRHIDPLPVLGRGDDDDAVGDWDDPVGEEAAKEDASANEMFDGETKARPAA